MLTRLTIFLTDDERVALQTIARDEMRGLRDQIRYLLRDAIHDRGLLTNNQQEQGNDEVESILADTVSPEPDERHVVETTEISSGG